MAEINGKISREVEKSLLESITWFLMNQIKINFTFLIFPLLIIFCPISLLHAQGSVMMVGGGYEDYGTWSDDPFAWFVEQADNGIIINIDTDQASEWYPTYFESFGADPQSHALQIATRTEANNPDIYAQLIAASGIFIEGGDQWDYVQTWRGTLVEDALHEIFQDGGVIGGTSAGLAILGEVVFDARYGSVYPEEAALNPYHERIRFTDDFLSILPDILTDSHFQPRARLGRLVPMIARRIQDFDQPNLIGVGVDENTAFCLDSNWIGVVYGEASVTILSAGESSQIICEPNQPLKFSPICYDQLIEGVVYDLTNRQLIDPGEYLQPVETPPSPGTYIDLTLNGSDETTGAIGEFQIIGLTGDPENGYYGDLQLEDGQNLVPHTIIIPRLWNDPDFSPNRWIGGQFGVAEHPFRTTIYLDDFCQSQVSAAGVLRVDRLTYLLDTANVTYTGINSYGSNIPGIVGATLHFLVEGDQFHLRQHQVAIDNTISSIHTPLTIGLKNYPNPFNPSTTICYHLPQQTPVKLQIFNCGGLQMQTLIDQVQAAGAYQVTWNADGYSSGIYILHLQTKFEQQVQTTVILK